MNTPYQKAAELLGWKWSQPHGGLINEGHRKAPDWIDYFVANDAQDACFQDGIESDAEAAAYVARHAMSLNPGM